MVEISSREESIKGLLWEYVGIVQVLREKDNFILFGSDSEFSGESGLPDMFIGEGDGFLHPVYSWVVLHQPGHSKDYLGVSQTNNHQGEIVFKGSGFTVDFGGSSDLSLFICSSVDVESLQRRDWSGWEEESLDEGRVNEVFSSSAVYEGSSGNGSHSIL